MPTLPGVGRRGKGRSGDTTTGRSKGRSVRKQVGTCILIRLRYDPRMINRERILEAAARVYAKHGFRGATTRLIALEAGGNEVTLFRPFGSKGALLQAVLTQQDSDCSGVPLLPEQPVDPVAELTAFTEASLQKLREIRPLLVQTMSELEERPEAADFACRGRTAVHDMLLEYSNKLHAD